MNMSVDQVHIGLLALTWLGGIVSMFFTVGKVTKVRRITYVLAIPTWIFFFGIYALAFATIEPRETFTVVELGLRVALGIIALEGILVPYVDRLEIKSKTQVTEIRIKP
jgi:hypothetical protein